MRRRWRGTLRAEQDESDARGTYSPAMHETFLAAGFYRITQPRLFGGYEFDLATYYRVMLEISRGHPGVGWCLALASSHAFEVASHWPEQAQYELFGNDGHFIAPHRAPPMGTLTPVDGGYLLDGTWDYCSGIPYATHCIVGALVKRDGAPRRRSVTRWCRARPARSSTTGAATRCWACAPAARTACASRTRSCRRITSAPCRPVSLRRPRAWRTARPARGCTATRCISAGSPARSTPPWWCRSSAPPVPRSTNTRPTIATRKTQSMPQMSRFQHFDFQRPFGHALTLTDAAEALMLKGCEMYADYCARWAADGVPITTEENMRLWGMIQHAGSMACEAVELLFHSAGSAPARKGHRLQRYFNDVAMYRGHSSAQQLNFASGLARLHFGLPWGMYGL